uniref:Reverse transcriptase domain-containing protein n=1 Tax=Haemonchus contortus TaxID=6289 RepID=A0A7I5EBK7_HAECO
MRSSQEIPSSASSRNPSIEEDYYEDSRSPSSEDYAYDNSKSLTIEENDYGECDYGEYDYNEVDDIVEQARSRPDQCRNEPSVAQIMRILKRRPDGPEDLSQTDLCHSTVEFTLDKKKRWKKYKKINSIDDQANTKPNKALVDLYPTFRGSTFWYASSGNVDEAKIARRLHSKAAVKGKSRNRMLYSHHYPKSPKKPQVKYTMVKCYSDHAYRSKLSKYRRRIDRTKRKFKTKTDRKSKSKTDEELVNDKDE